MLNVIIIIFKRLGYLNNNNHIILRLNMILEKIFLGFYNFKAKKFRFIH